MLWPTYENKAGFPSTEVVSDLVEALTNHTHVNLAMQDAGDEAAARAFLMARGVALDHVHFFRSEHMSGLDLLRHLRSGRLRRVFSRCLGASVFPSRSQVWRLEEPGVISPTTSWPSASRHLPGVCPRGEPLLALLAGGGDRNVAQLMVRNVDEAVVRELKKRAARRNHSAEQEHREILEQALLRPRRRSLAEVLAAMPDAGEDADFERRQMDRRT